MYLVSVYRWYGSLKVLFFSNFYMVPFLCFVKCSLSYVTTCPWHGRSTSCRFSTSHGLRLLV
uniref:Uncharacterized protein n=1 Tax=Arundo donax TaxID=35708 RepID=A0A0A9FR97_ARUDO